MNKETFIEELKKIDININDEQYNLFSMYANNLILAGENTNLTSIKDKDQIFLKHFYDSLCLTRVIDFLKINNVLDLGSGAGFPGIVLKIVFPKLRIVLLDSNGKKINFLRELVGNLNLSDIELVNQRAEDYCQNNRETFDLVTARAVAPLIILAELAIPFVKIGGNFVAMKGKNEVEINDSDYAIKTLGGKITQLLHFNLPIENSQRTLVKISKEIATNKDYPRRYDKIIKNPLKKLSK